MVVDRALDTRIRERLRDVITDAWAIVFVHAGRVRVTWSAHEVEAEAGSLLMLTPGRQSLAMSSEHRLSAVAFPEAGASVRSPWKGLSVPIARPLAGAQRERWERLVADAAGNVEAQRFGADDVLALKREAATHFWLLDRPLARTVLHRTLQAFWRDPATPTLAAFARHLGYTRSHLNDLMRESTGAPLSLWIRGVRMSRARDALREGAGEVGDVAAACGYDDPAYFARVFRSVHGATPTQWRSLAEHRSPAIRTARELFA